MLLCGGNSKFIFFYYYCDFLTNQLQSELNVFKLFDQKKEIVSLLLYSIVCINHTLTQLFMVSFVRTWQINSHQIGSDQ